MTFNRINTKCKLTYLCCKAFVVAVILLSLSKCGAQRVPNSPCPDIFSYEHNSKGSSIVGRVSLPNPSYGKHNLVITLSLKAQLITDFVGKVELHEEEDLEELISSGKYLHYKVTFPMQYPLPVVTSIKFKGNTVCIGPPERLTGPGQFITTIKLYHLIHARLSQPSNPTYYPINNNSGSFDFLNINTNQSYHKRPQQAQHSNNFNAINFGSTNNPYLVNKKPSPKPPSLVVTLIPTTVGTPIPTTVGTPIPTTVGTPATTEEVKSSSTANPSHTTSKTTTAAPDYDIDDNAICGMSCFHSESLIYNGAQTSPGDWPWLVAIFLKKDDGVSYICSGSLISTAMVVTAAHCTYDKPRTGIKFKPESLLLRMGIHNIQNWEDENGVTRGVDEVMYPPNFKENDPIDIDISILVMSKEIKYSNYIVPICIWSGPNIQTGINGSVAGWGRDEKQNRAVPEPRLVKMPIVNNDECKSSNDAFKYLLNEYKFCAGNRDGSGPCNGDSGSGLYIWRQNHFELKGVVSTSLTVPGSSSCDLSHYVLYSDAAKLSSWLRKAKYDYDYDYDYDE